MLRRERELCNFFLCDLNFFVPGRLVGLGRGGGTWAGWRWPIKRSSFMRYAEILAAPALRRLGRAGLEAPPLRGKKNLSF